MLSHSLGHASREQKSIKCLNKYKFLKETASASIAKYQPLYSDPKCLSFISNYGGSIIQLLCSSMPTFYKQYVVPLISVNHPGPVAYMTTYRLSSAHAIATNEYEAIESTIFKLMSLGPPAKCFNKAAYNQCNHHYWKCISSVKMQDCGNMAVGIRRHVEIL